jgi:hypothetical protein
MFRHYLNSVKKFSSISGNHTNQNEFSKKYADLLDKIKELLPIVTSIGGFIYYFDSKFSALDKSNNDFRIQSLKTEEQCKAIDGNVKIFSEQIIRVDIRNDMREIELRKAIECIRAEIRAEKRWH